MVKEEGVPFVRVDSDKSSGSTSVRLCVATGCVIWHDNFGNEFVRMVAPGNDEMSARASEDGCGWDVIPVIVVVTEKADGVTK